MDQLSLLAHDSPGKATSRPVDAPPDDRRSGISEDHRLGLVEEALGPPYYAGHGVRLYRRDCLEAMRLLPAGLINLTVTSPPYNIGKAYEARRDMDKYLSWCADWMGEIHRLTASDGAFWLNLGYVSVTNQGKAVPLPYLVWSRSQFFLMQEVVWNYGAGVAARLSFSPRNEKFLWYVKDPDQYVFNLDDVRDPDVKYPNQKKNGKLKCNPAGKNPGDVWQIAKVTSGTDRSSVERTLHPAQFPVALIERIIRASSCSGDLILDPFMGSGSSADVAVRLGRQAIGFEVVDDYLKIAVKRVEAAALLKAQESLF